MINIRQILAQIQDPVTRKALEELTRQAVSAQDMVNFLTGSEFGWRETGTDSGGNSQGRLEVTRVEEGFTRAYGKVARGITGQQFPGLQIEGGG